ncbi:MAG TPA: SRPBCC family protein [Pseudonocardiaceae bacterium]
MYHVVHIVVVSAVSAAPPAVVHELLADGPGWPAWSPIERVRVLRPGGADGVGAIWELVSGRVVGNDEITGSEPGRSFRYHHLRGLPVRDYHGVVSLAPSGGGTAIEWRATFRPRVPGTGPLLRLAVRRLLRGCADGLARHAARTSHGGPVSGV